MTTTPANHRRIFYTNMLLLGFDPTAAGQNSSRINFSPNMFQVPNKNGFEIVIHFLFDKLNHPRCREEFRDCWPVFDKKREQAFRRICHAWLCQIAQEESDSCLPRIVPSLFQSPGGDKFCQLLFAFSNYVLLHTCRNEHGMKSKEMLSRPVLTPQNLELGNVMTQSIQCSAVHMRKEFFGKIQDRGSLLEKWQKKARELTTEYRNLSKQLRQEEDDIRQLLSKHSDKGFQSPLRLDQMSKSPAAARRKHASVFDINVESVKRSDKVQKVRQLWKAADSFMSASNEQQAVVSSIVSGVISKHSLNAADLDIRVPEMLLRQCELELLKRDVSNTYQAGKLNLVRFQESELPELKSDLADTNAKIEMQSSRLKDVSNIKHNLQDSLVPEIKESIQQLKSKYHQQDSAEQTLLQSKYGLSLQEKTPPPSFKNTSLKMADLEAVSLTPESNHTVSTPEALAKMMASVNSACDVKQHSTCNDHQMSPLAQGKPRITRTRLTGDYVHSADSTPTNPGRSVEVERIGKKQLTKTLAFSPHVFSPASDNKLSPSHHSKQKKSLASENARMNLSDQKVSTETNKVILKDRGDPLDKLAQRVVDAMEFYSSKDDDEFNALYGSSESLSELNTQAFQSKDKIVRTPEVEQVHTANTNARDIYVKPTSDGEVLSDEEEIITVNSTSGTEKLIYRLEESANIMDEEEPFLYESPSPAKPDSRTEFLHQQANVIDLLTHKFYSPASANRPGDYQLLELMEEFECDEAVTD